MILYRVAPYPAISCVFEDGTDGNSIPLESIATVDLKVTDHANGTFDYEMASNIPVS
jgi:hypothetical protein